MNENRGFAPLAIVLIIAGVLVLAGGGWWAYKNLTTQNQQPAVQPESATSTVKTQGSQVSASVSVPGMTKYTDTDFGFSFWYPAAWTVQNGSIRDSYAGGSIQKTLTIAPPSNKNGEPITIDEFNSPNKEITIPSVICSPVQGYVTPATRYYFDSNIHTWMVDVAAATEYSEKDGSQYTVPATTKAADVSTNTMGGLHMLGAGCSGAVIPLSAHNFIVFLFNSRDTGPYYINLAKTIVAVDPLVATPVGAAKQIQTIATEGILFGALGTSIDREWYSYDGVIYDYNGTAIVGADATTFHPIEKGSGFAADGEHVYDDRANIIAGADPLTFAIVRAPDGSFTRFEKDKSHVWDVGKLIPAADSGTFAIVVNAKQPGDTFFQKDATHVWDYGKLIPGADPATFSIVNQPLWQSALFEIDSSHVWFDGHLIPGADPKTFVVDAYKTSDWTALMHDANHSYQLFNTLDAISSTTVKIDGGASILLQ